VLLGPQRIEVFEGIIPVVLEDVVLVLDGSQVLALLLFQPVDLLG
jgi:hypothetical protein